MSLFSEIFQTDKRLRSHRKRPGNDTAALFNATKPRQRSTAAVAPPRPAEAAVEPQSTPSPNHESQDVDNRTLFVGNLSLSIKQLAKKLNRSFSKSTQHPFRRSADDRDCMARHGAVDSVRIRSVPSLPGDHAPKRVVIHNKRFNEDASCNAYVVFKSAESAQAACALNLTEFQGRCIRVNFASPRRFQRSRKRLREEAGDFSPRDSVVLKNMSKEMTDDEVLRLFNDGTLVPVCKDTVRNWRIVRDHRSGDSKGYAFVSFKTKTAARAACTLNGHLYKKRHLTVEPLFKRVPRPQPSGTVNRAKRERAGHVRKRAWGTCTKGRFKVRR